ncbi:unnamed protein product [Phytophthora fragariaefolia]|uniref:Unnamed protein product n=1 Tax=Phytophthora fragariaefolia TaxID=1490495 RepID=A0A9W7CS86_9STRA|nr:unnamed protein product [Phytophthora fragariaefolia]
MPSSSSLADRSKVFVQEKALTYEECVKQKSLNASAGFGGKASRDSESAAAMAPVKKPQSSYLLFCNERRKQVMDENPGARIGDIQKIISVQWKGLKPEEKDVYVQLAAKDKERYQQELLDNPQIEEEPTAEEKEARDANACIYPLGRVRKIVQSDPDVGKVSKDALIAIAKASELFAQFLGTKSYEQALYRKKRQIKASDVTRTIQTTASLDWLREDFPDVKPTRVDIAAESKAKKDQQEKKPLPDSASFFKPRATADTNGTATAE